MSTRPSFYPQEYIIPVIERYINLEWSLVYKPRLVRQERTTLVGSLKYIDYAIPCFELANQLRLSPTVVARRLAELVNTDDDATSFSTKFKVESVDGYLNFQLSNEYLQQLKDKTVEWLKAQRQKRDGNDRLLFFETDGIPEGVEEYITSIYDSLNKPYAMTKFADILDNCLTIEEVNEFLNQYTKDQEGFIYDIKTSAIYFINGDEAFPLRSVKGKLYKFAFLLYLYNIELKKLDDDNNSRIIIFAPQKFHSYINKIMKDPSRTVLFDPGVSRADLIELNSHGQHLDDHLKQVKSTLYDISASDECIEAPQMRQRLFQLVDLPFELEGSLEQARFSAIFDHLNESYHSLELLAPREAGAGLDL